MRILLLILALLLAQISFTQTVKSPWAKGAMTIKSKRYFTTNANKPGVQDTIKQNTEIILENAKSNDSIRVQVKMNNVLKLSGTPCREITESKVKDNSLVVYGFCNANQFISIGFLFEKNTRKIKNVIIRFTPDTNNPSKFLTYYCIDITSG